MPRGPGPEEALENNVFKEHQLVLGNSALKRRLWLIFNFHLKRFGIFVGHAGGVEHCKSFGMCLKPNRACNRKFKAFKLLQTLLAWRKQTDQDIV